VRPVFLSYLYFSSPFFFLEINYSKSCRNSPQESLRDPTPLLRFSLLSPRTLPLSLHRKLTRSPTHGKPVGCYYLFFVPSPSSLPNAHRFSFRSFKPYVPLYLEKGSTVKIFSLLCPPHSQLAAIPFPQIRSDSKFSSKVESRSTVVAKRSGSSWSTRWN